MSTGLRAELRRREPETPLAAVAYSLGGNVLLKWLGESRADNPAEGGRCRVDPVRTRRGRRFDGSPASHGSTSGIWCESSRKPCTPKIANGSFNLPLSGAEIDRLRTFREFDEAVTAPLHGFRSAQDYYERCSSRQFVERIETPTLVLHAADDPLMHSGVIPPPEERSAHVAFEVSPNGGHVGFISGTLAVGGPLLAWKSPHSRLPPWGRAHIWPKLTRIEERGPRMGELLCRGLVAPSLAANRPVDQAHVAVRIRHSLNGDSIGCFSRAGSAIVG